MAFSMQDLMARLPGSPGGQPMVAPSFNPQINKPQLATDVQVNKDIIKADKNQQLGLMLHALGGALRGDKNFVQNTMAIQTMQEGKAKEKARIETLRKAVTDPEFAAKYPWAKDMYNLAGPDALSPIVSGIASSYKPTTDKSEFERNSQRLLYIDSLDPSKLSQTQATEKNILEQKIYGKSEPMAFYNKDAIQVETIDSIEYQKDPKGILDRMEALGLHTAGTRPNLIPKGQESAFGNIKDKYADTRKQLDVVNDLATIVYENKDAFTIAGGVADLFNTAKYQAESALTLSNLNKFQSSDPKGFERIDDLLDEKYAKQLDSISADRKVAKSIFYKLAYVTAKDLDPNGRLSDNDVRAAMNVIGDLSGNWRSTLANLQNVYKTREREYNNDYLMGIDDITNPEEIERAVKYKTLSPFLKGIDWNAYKSGATAPVTSQGSQLKIDPDIDQFLKNQGI
jgi:hypothetical protein